MYPSIHYILLFLYLTVCPLTKSILLHQIRKATATASDRPNKFNPKAVSYWSSRQLVCDLQPQSGCSSVAEMRDEEDEAWCSDSAQDFPRSLFFTLETPTLSIQHRNQDPVWEASRKEKNRSSHNPRQCVTGRLGCSRQEVPCRWH